MDGFLGVALRGPVVRRALGFALVVGAVLVGINYGDALLGQRALGASDWLKMGLTVCVPYVVSTLSSVAAIRDQERAQ
ncbi:MAG: nitrate/nitrite transporter NrtS [Deltaproteobacteria bacterium]|nr:nitrate/nitrite transporter NrtS [Deltaproteobacteria bacterium]MBW2372005.1 nitrate/nitrite transporter NrtS [Deltaproteobacteria bacterium]